MIGPLGVVTEDVNEMIDDVSSAGVKGNAITIGLAFGITYFIEMYQVTSAAVSVCSRVIII